MSTRAVVTTIWFSDPRDLARAKKAAKLTGKRLATYLREVINQATARDMARCPACGRSGKS